MTVPHPHEKSSIDAPISDFDPYADETLSNLYGRLRVGDGLSKEIEMGPLAHARRVDAMQTLVGDAQAKGGELLCGGQRLEGSGFFFPPTVITGCRMTRGS